MTRRNRKWLGLTSRIVHSRATVQRKRLSGEKGSMLEGGALVPMIVNWPGKTPAGKVTAELVDSTDFVPTFAELAGATLPAKTIIDGHSLAPQWQGRPGKPRDWIFIQLAGNGTCATPNGN